MNTSHEQAQQYLHIGQIRLTAEERSALTEHLAGCESCRAYADQLDNLQPVLIHALRTRPVAPRAASPNLAASIKIRQRRTMMRSRTFALAGTLIGAVLVAVLGLFVIRTGNGQGASATIPPSPSPASTSTPSGEHLDAAAKPDRFEPNDDFAQAALIELDVAYDNLNFAQLDSAVTAGSWDNDYFKVPVKADMVITCRTFNLSAGTDTNLILYDDHRDGITGQDDVDRAAGDLSSSVTSRITYEGWLYLLVGEGFQRSPAAAAQATYSLECSQANSATPTRPAAVSTLMPDMVDQRIDIGVATMHIRCMGKGSPTVVLDSGPGDMWIPWQPVMFKVAKFTRVCAYDRAGLGDSSRGPKPRTSQQMADELAALLDKGKIPGPYVLVPHATSNWIARLYTAQHRDQVAALVFVSPFHEDMISGLLAILAPYPGDLASTRQEMAHQGEGQSVEDWLTSADQVRAAGDLGDLPPVLLARSPFTSTEPWAPQRDAMLAQQQQQLLALSTNSTRLVAEKSGHFIYRDQPQAVIEAIQLAIEKIKLK